MRFGFTLIELIVAIAIGGLLLTTGAVRFAEFNQSQSVKGAGLTLKNNLRSIQSKGLAQVKPIECDATEDLEGYRVTFVSSGTYNTYRSQARCDGTLQGPITTYTLPTGFLFTLPPVNTTLDFYVLGRGASANQVVTIRAFSNPQRFYSMCVSRGGDIKDCGYQSGSAPTCTCP